MLVLVSTEQRGSPPGCIQAPDSHCTHEAGSGVGREVHNEGGSAVSAPLSHALKRNAWGLSRRGPDGPWSRPFFLSPGNFIFTRILSSSTRFNGGSIGIIDPSRTNTTNRGGVEFLDTDSNVSDRNARNYFFFENLNSSRCYTTPLTTYPRQCIQLFLIRISYVLRNFNISGFR